MRFITRTYKPFISDKYAQQSITLRKTYLLISALFNIMFLFGLDNQLSDNNNVYSTVILLRFIIIFGHVSAALFLSIKALKKFNQAFLFYAVLNQALSFAYITLLFPLQDNLHAIYFAHLLVTLSMAPLLLELNLFFSTLLPLIIFTTYLLKTSFVITASSVHLFINFNLLIVLAGFYTVLLRKYLQKLSIDNKKQKKATEREGLKLQRANYNLIKLDTFKTRVLSILTHDIKNPLLNVQGLIKFKQQLGKTDDLDEQIIHSTDNVLEFINNVLIWSASQMKGDFLDKTAFNIHELSEEILNVYKPLAEKKFNRLMNIIEPDTIVESDKNVIRLVLRNLISNAVKFTSEGVITIGALTENNGTEIFVNDTGIGMDEEGIRKIFDNSLSVSRLGTNNETGTGLGLAFVRDYLNRVGGDLYVTSKPGYGSTFYVFIPAQETSKQ